MMRRRIRKMTEAQVRSLPQRPWPAGFTLTEVLLVLVILGVIAAMVVPNLLGRQQEANIRATRASIKGFEDALKQFAVANNADFPEGSAEQAVSILLNPGQDASGRPISPYLEKVPTDAWNQPLYYEWPNTKVANPTKPAIWSSGPNRVNEDGAGDDINNWSELGR
ncbi:MAG: type II secretion system protein GspG [Planctomycetaceae bacterium]|nr:MAG: type II secretion system protein GspG [Planctomycetaceae bacterium]